MSDLSNARHVLAVLSGLGERKTPVVTGLLRELSPPQLELLAMIAQGYSNQEIA
ncbi:MAG: hypothetical protein GX040_05685, partial [Alcaligenaceae bacterium]|nr:hypothetical protein [Alcaligenaceae bacterium]